LKKKKLKSKVIIALQCGPSVTRVSLWRIYFVGIWTSNVYKKKKKSSFQRLDDILV